MSSRRYTVHWTEQAAEDLEEIATHIAWRSAPSRARKVISKLEARAAKLSLLPMRGRVVPELETFGIREWRELVVPPHRIIYALSGSRVSVLAVLDGRRDLQDELLLRLVRSREAGQR